MAKKLANDYLLWMKSGSSFALVKGQQTATIARSSGTIDLGTKDEEGWGAEAPGKKTLKISLDMIPNLPDATGYEALEAACNKSPAEPFEVQIRAKGSKATASDAVFHGVMYGILTETSFGQDDAVKAKLELSNAEPPIIDRLGPAPAGGTGA